MLVSLCTMLSGVGSPAQTLSEGRWVTNGPVQTMLRDGGTLYIGGKFSRVSPASGCGVPIDASTGAAVGSFPGVIGSYVIAAAPDGAGGWFIGGSFSSVGGLPRASLAHIASDLSVSPWNPGCDGDVKALVVSGSTVYVGGEFTEVGGQPRQNIAAIDASTGLVAGWDPNADFPVQALATSGTAVYAGGSFTNIGGQARNRIAALDAATGLAAPWNPNADNSVLAIAVSGSTVYAGGHFASIGGQMRNRLAALDAATGVATAWNPSPAGGIRALVANGATVYAGGDFVSIGGQTRNQLAALDAGTGLATAWNPNPDGPVNVLAGGGSAIYVGGEFTSMGALARSHLAAVDLATGIATSWSPEPNRDVHALAVSGSTVYVGGLFTGLGGVMRNNVAALDASTGIPTDWNPDCDNVVYALIRSGSHVYLGGDFGTVGGQSRPYLAQVEAATGLATSWNANVLGGNPERVRAMAVGGSNLYFGGSFNSVGGQTRSRLAAVDTTTGLPTAWSPTANGTVRALAVTGSVAYVGGSFSNAGGQIRRGLAAISLATGLATGWNPSIAFDGGFTVHALAVQDTIIYAGGGFTTVGILTRRNLVALGATGAMATPWDPGANNRVRCLALIGSTIYVGGEFDSIGGQAHRFLAALDPATGSAASWNLNFAAPTSPTLDPGYPPGVAAIAGDPTAIHVGGNFPGLSSVAHAHLATITLAQPLALNVAIVGSGTVTRNPDQATYDSGSIVQLTATPAVGWHFVSWSGDASGSASQISVTMDSDKNITATFAINMYTLNLQLAGPGTAFKSPDLPTYAHGASVTLTATPAPGAAFSHWEGLDIPPEGPADANPVTITMGASRTIAAHFTGPTVTLIAPTGEAAGDNHGFSVSSAGDVNGDGFADVIVGAFGYNGVQGRAYVYYGGPAADAVPDLTLTGEGPGDYFGYSVSSAGDVNGDGFADVIVGAYGFGSLTGRAYVYFGGPTPDATPDLILAAGLEGSQFGASVSSAGDVNGDGYSDVLVGAAAYNAPQGRAFVYFGAANPDSVSDLVLSSFYGGGNFGISVASAGDWNGDGYDDMVIGETGYSAFTGMAYLYIGGAVPDAAPDLAIPGEAAGSYFGKSVASAGDVNADGYDDLIVGAFGLNAQQGRAYVYYGVPPGTLDAEPDLVMTGTPGNYFGWSVASAGDLNGDGFSDVIVGEQGFNGGDGRALVYFGGALPDTTADVTLPGEPSGGAFGVSVSSAGDFDGDGFADIAAGAFQYAYGGPGRSYVVSLHASDSPPLVTAPGISAVEETATLSFVVAVADPDGDPISSLTADLTALPQGNDATFVAGAGNTSGVFSWRPAIGMAGLFSVTFTAVADGLTGLTSAQISVTALPPPVTGTFLTFTGETSSSALGVSVGRAGDVNGDGYDDIVVGSPAYGASTGRVHVYYGGPSADDVPDLVMTGALSGNYYGRSVSGAGDMNGDGYDDLVVGAYGFGARRGRAYVYFGGAAPDTFPDVVITGDVPGDSLGVSVSWAGDVNGDRYADIIVGAYGVAATGGRAYVFYGGAAPDAVADLILEGEAVYSAFGCSVASAGDANRDGYGDLIVGAFGYATNQGRAYLYFGGAAPDNVADVTLTGESAGTLFGFSVAGAGDVDGDGYDDVIVGGYGLNGNQGRAYVYRLGPIPDAVPDLVLDGEAAGDYFARSVASVGDVNGDGRPDLLVGALGFNALQGRAYLYYGGSIADASPDLVWTGEAGASRFGAAVGSAGDANGDGYPDVVVGAYAYGGAQGRAYVYTTHPADRPPLVSVPKHVSIEETASLALAVSAADPDGDPITALVADLSALPPGAGATFTVGMGNTNGTLQWIPARGTVGAYKVVFTATAMARSGNAAAYIDVAPFGSSITGRFTWEPTRIVDLGVHEIVFKAKSADGDSSSATTTVTVTPPSSGAAYAPHSPMAAPRAPSAAMKGPIVRAGPSVEATLGTTVVIEASASEATTLTVDTPDLVEGHGAAMITDREPVLDAPDAWSGDPGLMAIEFFVYATDPDGDPIGTLAADLSGLPPGHTASFVASPDNGSGTFSWIPAPADSGVYIVKFRAENALVRYAATAITVGKRLGGYWRLNGTLADAAFNYDLTAVGGVTFVPGAIGQAVDISGANGSYLEGYATYYSSILPSGSTLELWAKIRSLGYGENPVIMQAGAEEFGQPFWKLYVCGTTGPTGYAGFTISNPPTTWALQSNQSIDDGAWHHLAVTYDGATLKLYVDGTLDNSLSDATIQAATGNSPLRLGRYWTATATLDQFDGWLDEVRHWSVARSQAQIQADRMREFGFPTGVEIADAPRFFNRMAQNRPNPFNPRTVIEFELERAGRVMLAVYDVQGRLVRRLAHGPYAAGPHSIAWDGSDSAGRSVASGVYFYRLEAADFTASRRMVLLR